LGKTALITGASSGIGLELALIHAANGDDLVLVARNKQRLDELKADLERKYNIAVLTIGKDLSLPNAPSEVYSETKAAGIQVDYLINNAGFGNHGLFAVTDWNFEQSMMNLNMTALTEFTKLYLPDMIERGNGRIMNVASSAGFMPCPGMAVYFATKAYVLSFSEALSNEVKSKGVTVTALCPGPTNTGFEKAASMGKVRAFDMFSLPTAKDVAEYGYKSMMNGKTTAIHGFKTKLAIFLVRFSPRKWVPLFVRWAFSSAD
jgi:hypothetical protein